MRSSVESSITVNAAPERVWKAWVEEMNRWWTKPYYNDHALVTGLVMEPRLGGRYFEQWGAEGEGYLIGTIIEWLPPQRLGYTWSERGWGGVNTVVRLEFSPTEGGSTLLRCTHEGFERLPDGAKTQRGYQEGWEDLIRKVKAHVEETR